MISIDEKRDKVGEYLERSDVVPFGPVMRRQRHVHVSVPWVFADDVVHGLHRALRATQLVQSQRIVCTCVRVSSDVSPVFDEDVARALIVQQSFFVAVLPSSTNE